MIESKVFPPRTMGFARRIRREAKAAMLACPVALCCACGPDRPVQTAAPGDSSSPGYDPAIATVLPGAPAVFGVQAAGPDTVGVFWAEGSHVGDIRTVASPGSGVVEGDTLAVGTDSVAIIDLELAEMSLSLAEARSGASPGDSALIADVALAAARCSVIEASSRIALISPVEGDLLSVSASAAGQPPGGQTERRPGAEILAGGPGLVSLVPPPSSAMVHWPESAGELRFVEERDGTGIYSGEAPEGSFSFPGSFSIPRRAVLDSGLSSLVVLDGGDSIRIEPVCSDGAFVTALGPIPGGAAVRVWTGP